MMINIKINKENSKCKVTFETIQLKDVSKNKNIISNRLGIKIDYLQPISPPAIYFSSLCNPRMFSVKPYNTEIVNKYICKGLKI